MTGCFNFLLKIERWVLWSPAAFAMLIKFISHHLAEILGPTHCPFGVSLPPSRHMTKSLLLFLQTSICSSQPTRIFWSDPRRLVSSVNDKVIWSVLRMLRSSDWLEQAARSVPGPESSGKVFPGTLRRHFFIFASNAVSQRHRSAQALPSPSTPVAQ